MNEQQMPDIKEALANLQNGNLQLAYNQLQLLSEAGNPVAQNTLAVMFMRGDFAPRDVERALFWWAKAADAGNNDARCNFGDYVLLGSEEKNNEQRRIQAENYLAASAGQQNKRAVELLANYVLNNRITGVLWNTAKETCRALEQNATDSFEKEKYAGLANSLEALEKSVEEVAEKTAETEAKNVKTVKVVSAFSAIASVLWIVIFAGLFLGVHSDLHHTDSVLAVIPSVSKGFLIPIPFYRSWVLGFMDVNGAFALELIVLAAVLDGIGSKYEKLKYARIIKTFSVLICLVIYAGHLVVQYQWGFSIFANMLEYLIMILVSWVIGKIIGAIIKKIAKI